MKRLFAATLILAGVLLPVVAWQRVTGPKPIAASVPLNIGGDLITTAEFTADTDSGYDVCIEDNADNLTANRLMAEGLLRFDAYQGYGEKQTEIRLGTEAAGISAVAWLRRARQGDHYTIRARLEEPQPTLSAKEPRLIIAFASLEKTKRLFLAILATVLGVVVVASGGIFWHYSIRCPTTGK